jgi:hypothetical protein
VDQAQQARRPVAQLGRARPALGAGPRRQRGWVGLIVILIALVIVALLAQKALKSYGLLPGADETTAAGNRVPPAASPAGVDPTSVPATPAATIQRARGLEQQLQREAEDQGKRIDEQSK